MKNTSKNKAIKLFIVSMLMTASLASSSVAAYGHGSIIAKTGGQSRSASK
jgi:hypothetical protein